MSKKKTHEEYVAELARINPNIEVVGVYSGAHTKILHRCKIDGYEWFVSPNNILKGRGCPKCAGKMKRTQEEYIKEVSLINSNIKVLGTYINNNTPILHECLIHNVKWNAVPYSVLDGHGCRKCGNEILANDRRKNREQYVRDLMEVNPNIIVVGEYINAHTPTLHRCLIDGYEWYAKPNNILSGRGCPKCGGTMKKLHEEYVEELALINPSVEVIGQYIDAKTPISHKCLIDGCVWDSSPTNMLSKGGCPQCNESLGERQVRQWLEKRDIKYEFQKPFKDCCDKKPLPFDFYLENYNVAIEYQGGQHYYPVDYFGGEEKFKLQQKHDNIKREYCKNNGIRLLEIPYYKKVEEELNNFLFI